MPAFVCLSVSKITQNACMDLDEMLRIDRCRDINELINFSARTGLLSPMSFKRCYAEFYIGKSDVYILAAAARRGFNMALFTAPVSRPNTFAWRYMRSTEYWEVKLRCEEARKDHTSTMLSKLGARRQ